jgi:hypothetical protein
MKKNCFGRLALMAILFVVFCPQNINAQWFRLPGVLQRYEIGYSYSISNATYKKTDNWNGSSGKLDTSFSENVTSKAGFGAVIGTAVPLKRLGGKCMLALGIGYGYNMYTWDYKTPSFGGTYTDGQGNVVYDFNQLPVSGISLQMSLPLSADFKFGNDAFLNKNLRWGTTIGAGVYPTAALTADFDNAGFGFGAAPFVKAELSFFAGICFKLRAQYAIGYIPFYDNKNSLSGWTGYDVKSSLIGKQQINFSLILMPFSWAWQERGWWNTY